MRIYIIIALALVGLANLVADAHYVIPHYSCPRETACAVHEVYVNLCKIKTEYATMCLDLQGTHAVHIDFTPPSNWTRAFSRVIHYVDKFKLRPKDSPCPETSCPLTSGVRQTYTSVIKLDSVCE